MDLNKSVTLPLTVDEISDVVINKWCTSCGNDDHLTSSNNNCPNYSKKIIKCPKCRNSDHQRSNNKLCKFYKPRTDLADTINPNRNKRHDLGKMEFECKFCNACFWKMESLSSSTRNQFKFGMCCKQN